MTNTTRLIVLQVRRYGGEEAMRRRTTHCNALTGFTRHRRRIWWALQGRSTAARQPLHRGEP